MVKDLPPSQRVVRELSPAVSEDSGKTPGRSLAGPDPCTTTSKPEYTGGLQDARRGQSWHRRPLATRKRADLGDGVEPGHTPRPKIGRRVRMLLSFQRPSHLSRRDCLLSEHPGTGTRIPKRTDEYSATAMRLKSPNCRMNRSSATANPGRSSRCASIGVPPAAAPCALGDDLNVDGPLARAVVEIDQDDLLPGPQREPAVEYRD
jgi:hypothetical protein